jgi:YfiH family protein
MQRLSLCLPLQPLSENVYAFSTTRDVESGHSVGNQKQDVTAFNLGFHVADHPQHVQLNRALLKQQIESSLDSRCELVWLDQVHSNEILSLDSKQAVSDYFKSSNLPKADAVFTNQPNLALCIMTADCVPILLSDREGKQIAAIHAGWKGLYAGIIEKTLSCFDAFDAGLQAWIGPCISQSNFETSIELVEAFRAYPSAIIQSELNGKYHIDLKLISELKLRASGVKHIQVSSGCTYADADSFFSHRRSTHLGQLSCGRMANVIIKQ